MLGGLTMADLFNELLNSVDSLSDEQLAKLVSKIDQKRGTPVKKEKEETKNEVICLYCKKPTSIKKFGKSCGRQRYMCKECNRTFCTSTGSLLSGSRLTEKQWRTLLKCIVFNLSVKDTAKEVGIARSSAWQNKIKVCYALYKTGEFNNEIFTDIAECDEYYAPVSFKGKRDPRFFIYTLGRMPRHHMNREEKINWLVKNGLYDKLKQNDPENLEFLLQYDGKLQGISREQTCILTCKDRGGHLYMKPTCIGRMKSSDVNNELHGKFEGDAIIVTDSHNAYNAFAESEHIHHEPIEAGSHSKGPFNLARINELHSELAGYWSKSARRIPATKYMEIEILMFMWLQKHENLTSDEKVELLYGIVSKQSFSIDSTYDEIKSKEMNINTNGYFPNKV